MCWTTRYPATDPPVDGCGAPSGGPPVMKDPHGSLGGGHWTVL